jgi:heavy metal translocating P-type ATPase
MNQAFALLSGLRATIAGGLFLAASLAIMLTRAACPVDPAWLTVAICGFPLFYLALTELVLNRTIVTEVLISLAMIASIAIGELFAAGEVAFIMALGAILEEKTVERARKGIKQLVSLTPETGRRMRDGKEEIVPAEQIRQGDILRILPGEAVPVDGEIVAGATSIDQSVITGESLPVDKAIGDEAFCGTINRFGSIDIRVTRIGEDSSLQKLIRLVREAENNKAPMQRIVDKWAAWLVPIALAIAVITYFATSDIVRAVTILVVFCPCALALATPTSIMAAIGQATKHGVIIKSGEALENMGKVDMIAFDKTGTLTHGNLAVSDIASFDEAIPVDELLRLTASAEARSEHPLGKAISAYAHERNIALREVGDFRMLPGKGISADVDGKRLLCGNAAFLAENGVSVGEKEQAVLDDLHKQGKATVIVARENVVVGVAALSDTLRETANTMIRELRKTGTEAVLLTGDHARTAAYFAGQVGISNVHAELLPEHKVEQIQIMQKAGHHVCMIGDGVNDAPALKIASVGVAMGGMGSDIAIEAADIALIGDDIAKIPYLKRLSNATIRLIKTNITLSMAINFVAVILSVLGVLGPISGALVHNAGSVLVVLNAALLYDRKI